jgi:hypothetical protein
MTKKKAPIRITINLQEQMISIRSHEGIERRPLSALPWGMKLEIGGVVFSKKRLFDVGPVLEFHKKSYAIVVDGQNFDGYQVPIAV